MEDKENAVKVTRQLKKRTAEEMSGVNEQPQLKTKNRAVLGEISNLSKVPQSILPTVKNAAIGTVPTVPKAAEEIDSKPDDPQMCNAYAVDIYQHLHSLEIEESRRPLPDYMEKIQNNINARMRGILVNWLVEVAEEFAFSPNTLYLAISYIDRFLSTNMVDRSNLQLVGVTSLLVAGKFEEMVVPTIDKFCYITAHSYRKKEVVKMETEILKSLNYEISSPTIWTFLRNLNRIAQEDYKNEKLYLEYLGYFLAELSLLDYDCVKFLPSRIASSVVFLSRFTLRPDHHPWNSALQKCSGYKPSDLKECSLILQDLQIGKRRGSLVAVRDKYKQHKFKQVGSLKPSRHIPSSYFEDIR